MKIRKSFWMVLVALLFVALLLPVVGSAAQGAAIVPVVVYEFLVESQDGEVTFPGGNYHVRGAAHVTEEVSENSCLNGPGFIEYKVNVNKNGHVYAGGTWVIESERYEGSWEMKWHVTTNKPIVAVGHGTGDFEGMQIKLAETEFDDGENSEADLKFVGQILVPPSAQVQCTE